MNYEVYCDESGIEALFDKNAHKYTVIGGIWIPKEYRGQLKKDLNEIKHRFNVWGEIKWNKISPAYLDMYKEVIDLFFKSPKLDFEPLLSIVQILTTTNTIMVVVNWDFISFIIS